MATSPARAASSAPHHYPHVAPSYRPHVAPRPAIYHAHVPQPPRVVPPAVTYHSPVRPPVVIRPIITTYIPPRPVYSATRVVAVPGPYYGIVGSGYTGTDLAYPAEPNWNWTPVESITALAGKAVADRSDIRYYCPDTREYYPVVEICPSPWLKVIP